MKPSETGWKPGIVKLKDTALSERRIERLGPPPGNAEVLIRGGAGWVFGIPVKQVPVDPRITRLQPTEPFDEVMHALWRELAYQWRFRRGRFSTSSLSTKSRASHESTLPARSYTRIEQGFLQQAAVAWPGMSVAQSSLNEVTVPSHPTTGASCFDPRTGGSCAAGTTCRACQEGLG